MARKPIRPPNIRPALRELRILYGDPAADELGPIALKNLHRRFVELGQSRGYVNKNVDRIKRIVGTSDSPQSVGSITHNSGRPTLQ